MIVFCVGPKSKLVILILEDRHCSKIRGHAGYFRALYQVSQQFFWKGLAKSVKQFSRGLYDLSKSQNSDYLTSGASSSATRSNNNLGRHRCRFITGLPPVQGHAFIIVMVDRLSKYYHLGSLPVTYTASFVVDYLSRTLYGYMGYRSQQSWVGTRCS